MLALMEKLRAVGTPLGEYVQGRFYRGVLTGLNEAFVIDEATRQRLIAEDPKSAELIKPWLRGRDIRKWKAEWAGLYLIYIPWHFEKIDQYPAIKQHLAQFKAKLEKRGATEQGRYEWYELQRYASEYYQEFEKPKIMWRHFTTVPEFIYDEGQHYSNDKSYILPTADLSLLGLLNAKVTNYFLKQLSPPVRGGFIEMRIIYLEQLPVPSMLEPQKSAITQRVQTILAAPDAPGVPALEKEIDELVYQLYGLTPVEIALVEGKR
ncbi:MAG TPA: TaqI-like C-terminal specificity domain-containing protein [Dissulfurispiraceae bacterium]|nr:TaqI-like C-terminal specificity domain-containing protein [Dissulfurispiraceae bacterium]